MIIAFVGFMMLLNVLLYAFGVTTFINADAQTFPLFPLLLGLFFIVFYPIMIYRGAKKNFASNPKLSNTVKYEIDEDMIRVSGEGFHTDSSWNEIYKVTELNEWVLIYISRFQFYAIPKDKLGHELTTLRTYIRNAGVQARLRSSV